MDQKELQEKIALYFSKLTPKAQASFSSMLWLEILKKISDKYSLDSKQIETLSTETTLMLLGVVHTDEYEKVLYEELNLPKEIVTTIIDEINISILKGVREELNDIYQKNTKELEEGQNRKYEELDKRFKDLPKEIQDAVSKAGYHDALYKIFEENKLNIEQMGILENTIMDMLTGALRPEKFKEAIKRGLGLEDAKTEQIVKEVNEKILKEIKGQVVSANKEIKEETINTEEEDRIMKSAGIEINRNGIDKSKVIMPNKLLNSVKIPITHTDHSLMNITKNNEKPAEKIILTASTEISAPKQKTEIPQPTPKVINDIKKPNISVSKEEKATDSKPASYLKNKDPYRLSPDE